MEQPAYCILDGQLMAASEPLLGPDNRAFRYGDGVFETIRIVRGQVFCFEHHYSRLKSGLGALRIDLQPIFTQRYFEDQITKLIERNQISHGGIARLQVFRGGTGTYKPTLNSASYVLTVVPHSENDFEMNDHGQTVGIFSEIPKTTNKLSNFKTANALTYILAGIYAKEQHLDEALLLNQKGMILEATSSNLFIVSNGVLYTPALEDGCVGGTMRMKVINLALENEMKIYECSLTPQNLLAADEVFLTNSIAGLRWIKSYQNKRYFNKTSRFLTEKLNGLVAESLAQKENPTVKI